MYDAVSHQDFMRRLIQEDNYSEKDAALANEAIQEDLNAVSEIFLNLYDNLHGGEQPQLLRRFSSMKSQVSSSSVNDDDSD